MLSSWHEAGGPDSVVCVQRAVPGPLNEPMLATLMKAMRRLTAVFENTGIDQANL